MAALQKQKLGKLHIQRYERSIIVNGESVYLGEPLTDILYSHVTRLMERAYEAGKVARSEEIREAQGQLNFLIKDGE